MNAQPLVRISSEASPQPSRLANLPPSSKSVRGFAVLAVLLLIALPATTLRAQSCSGVVPAFAVTDNLWLDGVFQPGETPLPANQLPAERDSSQWDSLSTPGFHSGNSIFESLDIAGDYLYVGYNAGVSVWNIAGANAENPERVAVRDGWNRFACQMDAICAPFLEFPGIGENDFLVEDVAVLANGSVHYVALSGRSAVGLTLWQFNTATETLTPVYQDLERVSRQVRLVEVNTERGGSTIYAFSSYENGLAVYDVTRALAITPCLEETGSDCPGVYLGNVGSISSGRYLDVLQRPTGQLLIANSDGAATSLGLELWEVNPSNPSAANQVFSGLDEDTYGPALFTYEGNDYLAALERDGGSNVIKIFNVNACRGGCSLGAPVFDDIGVPPRVSNQFLTYSTSNGTPFLYYGVFGGFGGAQVEQLLNLTTLGRPGQNITEMTDGGPTYFDNCRNTNLDYWAWYYPANEFGTNNFSPQIGRFDPSSNYFYRAARGTLDVHVWEAGITPTDPTITTTVSTPDPQGLYWMGDEITFEGEGADGCNPTGIWTWTAVTPPQVDAITVSEIGDQVTYRFECNAGSRCADAIVSVSGTNSAASCDGAITSSAAITVKDPEVELGAINPSGGTVTQCVDVDFTAGLVGRGPITVGWSVRRDPALDPDQNPQQTLDDTVTNEDLSTTSSMFTWSTSTASFAEIFSDGFESGDLLAWGVPALLAEDFVVEAGPSSRGIASVSATVELTSISGDPTFGSPAITSMTVDDSTFDFQSNTVPGTVSEWNWELEDDDGTSLCTFGVDTNVPCVLMTGQNISHTWVLQTGDRRVDLTISNCQTSTTAEASTTVAVVSVEQLEIVSFELDRAQSNGACEIDFDCLSDLICICHINETVFFEVISTGSPDFYDFDWDGNGTFEDTNNPATGTEFTNVFPVAIGQVMPGVQARRGAATPAEKDLRETLDVQP